MVTLSILIIYIVVKNLFHHILFTLQAIKESKHHLKNASFSSLVYICVLEKIIMKNKMVIFMKY